MRPPSRNLTLGLVFLVILLVLVLLPHSRSQREVEKLKAELRASGQKLTLSELAPPPATNREQVLAREMFLTNMFALPGVISPQLRFAAAGQAYRAWETQAKADVAFPGKPGPGPADPAWSHFDGALTQQSEALQQLQQALRTPAADAGWPQRDPLNLPKVSLVRMRIASQALAAAALVKLHEGNLPAAQASLGALINVAQVNRNLYLLNAQWSRTAVAQYGLDVTWQALQAPGWTEESLAALQHHWEEVDLGEVRERSVAGELAADLDVFQRARALSGRDFRRQILYQAWEKTSLRTLYFDKLVLPAYKAFNMADDELLLLRSMTNFLHDIRLLNHHAPWPEVTALLKQHTAHWDRDLNAVRFHRFILGEGLVVNFARAMETMMQVETQRQMTIAAIAIQRYEAVHGQPPPDLAALVPQFLAAPPADPMSGKTLCYRPNPQGGFILYSVGEDGVDNGGEAGFGLWAGRDAVWPKAATRDDKSETPGK